jgi:hypothetical protein
MNGRFQMQGGKNWFLPKEMNANRFFWDSHWLEIWSNHFYPSMGPNGGSVAMDSGSFSYTPTLENAFLVLLYFAAITKAEKTDLSIGNFTGGVGLLRQPQNRVLKNVMRKGLKLYIQKI